MIIEAAKQALEALESIPEEVEGYLPESCTDAVIALRTAIAEAEKQEPVAWPCEIEEADFGRNTVTVKMLTPNYAIRAGKHWLSTTPPAAQQEPVAWIEHIAGGVEYSPYHQVATKLPEGVKFDLYTYPPAAQRQPLTEIAEALRRYGLTLVQTTKGYDVMRLGEISAHGIGGKHD
jgi:hypothetical protein